MDLFLLYGPVIVFLYVALNSSPGCQVGNCLTWIPLSSYWSLGLFTKVKSEIHKTDFQILL